MYALVRRQETNRSSVPEADEESARLRVSRGAAQYVLQGRAADQFRQSALFALRVAAIGLPPNAETGGNYRP